MFNTSHVRTAPPIRTKRINAPSRPATDPLASGPAHLPYAKGTVKALLGGSLALGLAVCPAATAWAASAVERASVAFDGTQAAGPSSVSDVSDDGRFVAFISRAGNLVAGDTNATWDVFVRDSVAGTTKRVSVSTSGAQTSGYVYDVVISGDGRYVAFTSNASTLVPNDTNGTIDTFVHDTTTATTTRVSVSSSGQQASGGHDRHVTRRPLCGLHVASCRRVGTRDDRPGHLLGSGLRS